MSWTFRIGAIVIGVALLAGAFVVLRPPPVEVEVAKVVRASLAQTVVDDGRARVRERYTVSVPVAGTLARIDLSEGDGVEPGTVLARLLPLASPLLDPESRKAAEQRVASAIDGSKQSVATVARAQASAEQTRKTSPGANGWLKRARSRPHSSSKRGWTPTCEKRSWLRRSSRKKSQSTASAKRARSWPDSNPAPGSPSSSGSHPRSMVRSFTS